MSFQASARGDIDPLAAEQARIARTRRYHEELRARLLDSKARVMGVDVEAIQKQREDKTARKAAEKQASLNYDREMQGHYQELSALEAENRRALEERNQKHAEFVRSCNRTQSDTWDINDPNRVRNQFPPRHPKAAPSSASSIQKFSGEDDGKSERIRRQQNEVRLCANAQIQAQQAAKEGQRFADMEFAQEMTQNVELAKKIAAEQDTLLQRRRLEVGQDNIRTTEAHSQEAKDAEAARQAECAAEIAKKTSSDLLTENLGSTYRSDNSGRRVPYHFKGFDQQQRQAFLDAQKQQVQDKKARQQAEREADMAYVKRRQEELRELTRLEHEQRAREQATRNGVRDTQLQQRVEQKEKLDHLNNVVYKNSCEEYLGYFGRSHR